MSETTPIVRQNSRRNLKAWNHVRRITGIKIEPLSPLVACLFSFDKCLLELFFDILFPKTETNIYLAIFTRFIYLPILSLR